MAKYTVTGSHSLGGGKFAEVGDVIELDEKTGRERTGYNLVRPYRESDEGAAAAGDGKGKPAGNGKGKKKDDTEA